MNYKKTKIFMSGNSRAVRIPKNFHLTNNEFTIRQNNNQIILEPIYITMQEVVDNLKQEMLCIDNIENYIQDIERLNDLREIDYFD